MELQSFFLDSVIIDDQISFDGNLGYYSAGSNMIHNPGSTIEFDRDRDYFMPGFANPESILWIDRAYRFAEKYNTRRDLTGN